MSVSFVKIYNDLRKEHPEIKREVIFRGVCSTIARSGTFNDFKALNNYFESEMEAELHERSTAAV